ncbi:MAG: type II toxin-antitoxin system VapC family toxin [Roseiflexaceae bacterium]
MVTYLLDTNVIAELVKPMPNQDVVRWVDARDEQQLYVSVITIGELLRGIAKHPQPARQAVLAAWVHDQLVPRFADRIVPVSLAVMRVWADVTVECERRGRPLPAIDSLIAASALSLKATIVTRNVSDFVATGVDVVNPWGE